MDISYKKSYLEDQVDNCTTFDELTPNAFFERVVLDLSGQAGQQHSVATSHIFMSFKEEVQDPGAKVWFDVLDETNYAGLRLRVIQTSNQDVTEKLVKFLQELTEDRQNNNGAAAANGTLSDNNSHYASLFTPSDPLEVPDFTKVVDSSLSEFIEAGATYMEQKEENASIIKSFEISIEMGESDGEYFPRTANQNNEHLSYFAYIYVDLDRVAEEYEIDVDINSRINLFPYGQISFINVLGDYKTGLNMSQVSSGPGRPILCDLRELRRFRESVDITEEAFRDSFSSIRRAVTSLTEERVGSPLIDQDGQQRERDQRSVTIVDPEDEQGKAIARSNLISAQEINKITGDQGFFTDFWHSKDQKDNIRFIFGLDIGRFASENSSYPILLKSSRLRDLSGIGNVPVFDLRDMKINKIRLKEGSKGTTSLAGNTKLEIFDENTDYKYVAGIKDNINPIYRDNRARFLEQQLEEAVESSDVRFFSGKDNLKAGSQEPGTYKYRVESVFIDNSPRYIKALARRLERQADILREAHNELAGRHVFNQEFVSGEDQPGAIATRTMGGFFLRERGTNLQIQEETFANIREQITPAAMVVANIAEEINILAGTIERNARHRPRLGQVIGYLLGQIRPDATGQSLNMLEEITSFATYLANQFRRSVRRSLVNFTSDEDKGTRSSGTGSDIVGGKRIIKDTHDFVGVVNNLKTKKTGVDLVSWWEQNDQDKGLKGYDFDLYARRVNGEVSKFYTQGHAPLLDNLWTYMTPALIKLAGRESVSPYVLGDRTRPSMYSYNDFANFHADLYDYKFNSKYTQPYHLYEPTYSEHDKTKDRLRPDTYQNKTIKQILNQHCEIEIGAIDEKYRDKSGKPKLKKSEIQTSLPNGGIYQIFGSPDGTADEATADSLEAAFGDSKKQKQKIMDDYYVKVVSKEKKTFTPTVTRIFYTLMGEMVLAPNAAEYADARYNSFAGIEDQIAADSVSADRAESQEEFEERQERLREQLEAAEDALEEARRAGNSLANQLHEDDITNNRRTRNQINGEPYPVPSLMERMDPLYEFGTHGDWHVVLIAEEDGYFGETFLNQVRNLPTQEERVDAICRYVRENVIEEGDTFVEGWIFRDEVVLINQDYRTYYGQMKEICEELRTNANTRREQAEVDRLRDELAERPPTLGDIRDIGPRQRGLPIQLQALTDIANYVAVGAMGEGGTNTLAYNQPVLIAEPYTEIPIDKSMLAISDINGNSVTLANVYDIMKDHSKFAPFWYNYKHIYEIQYLDGFDKNIREPMWKPLTEQVYFSDANTGEIKPVLCRIVGYDNDKYGVDNLGITSLPIYNEYFFLEKEQDTKLPPDLKGGTDFGGPFIIDPSFTPEEIFVPEFTPNLPPGISTTPAGAITNDSGFFGAIPATDFNIGDFSSSAFDFVTATGAGITNPRTNINTIVNNAATLPNMSVNPNIGSGISGRSGY